MRIRHSSSLLYVLALALALPTAACSSDADTDAAPGTAATEVVTPSEQPASATPSAPTPTPADDASPVPLAGEPYHGPPVHGQPGTLAVVGVAADDVLNVRAGPGTDHEVVATLSPLATDVRATGRGRLLPSSIWLEVEYEDGTGWASSAFLAHLGATSDVTTQVIDAAGGRPQAETLVDLATIVADTRASVDPPSRVVISNGPDVGDLGEVTVDIVGLGDDAVFAERLVVFATEDDSGEGFTLRTVEATEFCARGGNGEDPCP